MTWSPALTTYLAASHLAGPLAHLVLKRRAAQGREDLARLGERLGRAGTHRPDGPLIWLHGASVGEAQSILPLIAEIRRQAPAATCLVTSGTVSSANHMAETLPYGCIHQYVPVDTTPAVDGFLNHWQPDLGIWVESEFWPALMAATARRNIPMMLVNARISHESARRWARLPGMAKALVRMFSRIVTQDDETVQRLISLGAEDAKIGNGGNLKALAPVPGCDPNALDELKASLSGRPVWFAASTHAPEEEAVAQAHQIAAAAHPGLLTILAPRHPRRADEIAALMTGHGPSVSKRSAGEGPDCDVWLADTFGEMGLWYRLAPVSFVGGSIADQGGHNPFEPAALDSAILHGPQTRNFAPVYQLLQTAGGARCVADGQQLGNSVATLLADSEARQQMADAARSALRAVEPNVRRLASDALSLAEIGG